jgi:hypothetical protein
MAGYLRLDLAITIIVLVLESAHVHVVRIDQVYPLIARVAELGRFVRDNLEIFRYVSKVSSVLKVEEVRSPD